MRIITTLMSIAFGAAVFGAGCGGGPALGGVPHPNNAAMAGGVAAAAAAITLADPGAANRKPEQRAEQEKKPVDVKEQVPASAFDRLDANGGSNTGSAAKPAPAATTRPTSPAPAPVLPSPHDAVDPDHPDAR